MTDRLVRVRGKNHEYSVGAAHAAANDLDVIDAPAADRFGAALPPTPIKRESEKPAANSKEK